MHNLLQDEHFWIYICFFLFFIIFGKTILKHFKKFLEDHVNVIKSEIEDSETLLNSSRTKLIHKRNEMQHLEKRVAELEKLTQEKHAKISEDFYKNLKTKEQILKQSFDVYFDVLELSNLKRLESNLINGSYEITKNLLQTSLVPAQKQEVLNTAINNIPQALINIQAAFKD